MKGTGERIKSIRKNLGLNQGAFSKKIEISQSMLSGIESERETLTERNMKLICLEFGVNPEWLQNGGDIPMFKSMELSPDEKELLDIYDKLSADSRKDVRRYANERLELQELREQQKILNPAADEAGVEAKLA